MKFFVFFIETITKERTNMYACGLKSVLILTHTQVVFEVLRQVQVEASYGQTWSGPKNCF